jgi:hypothetical protein
MVKPNLSDGFFPSDVSCYEEIDALGFFNQLVMPNLWDIEFRSGVAFAIISKCLCSEYNFVIVNDHLVVFSPSEIERRVALSEE